MVCTTCLDLFMAAGSGPEYVLSVMPQSVKSAAMPVQCAAQLHYTLTPHSAITLTAVHPVPQMQQP